MAKALQVLTFKPSSFNALLTKGDMKATATGRARHKQLPASPHVYLGNLPVAWAASDVQALVGTVTGAPLKRIYLRQKYPGGSQHAFVLAYSTADAGRCVTELDGLSLDARHILKVSFCSPQYAFRYYGVRTCSMAHVAASLVTFSCLGVPPLI